MQLIRNFQNINRGFQNTVLTLGNFDGLHLGHQEILKRVGKIAKDKGLKSALLTFEPHPIRVIRPDLSKQIRLTSLSQKLRFLREHGLIELVFAVNFTSKLANLEAENFIKTILVEQLKINHLVIGYDFVFGRNRLGSAALLEHSSVIHDFGFTRIEAKCDDHLHIYSSSKIRNLIALGEIKEAGRMLGRPFEIQGRVTKGIGKAGDLLGFKTANLVLRDDIIHPHHGVYKVKIVLKEKTYQGVANFGIKPTFESALGAFSPVLEVHIFDFNQLIYGQKIRVKFEDFIREEKKFNNFEELKSAIARDCQIARN